MNPLVYLFFVLLVFASCSNKDATTAYLGKPIKQITPVKLNWVGHWHNEGFKEQLLYDMARRFEFENQDIVLNLQFPGDLYPGNDDNQFDFNEFNKPTTDWDILRINNEVSGITKLSGDPEWAAKYLVDFSQIAEFRENSLDVVNSDDMKKRWGGIVPGHALDAHSFVLWCNKDVAEKLGITIKQFDISADDFENYLKLLENYNIKNNTQIYAFPFNDGWSPVFTLAQQLFSSIINDYDKLKDFSYSEEKINAWHQVLTYCQKLSAYHPIDLNWKKYQYGNDYDKPLNGESLFMINGTWMYNIWQKLDSVNYLKMIPLELPAVNPAQTYIGEVSIPWIVPKNAAHREEAIRFMLYWCKPEVADEWVRNTKSPTGIKGNVIQSTFGFDVYETFDYMIAKKYNGKKLAFNFNNNAIIFGNKNASVPNYFIEVITGLMTSNDAMNSIRRHLSKN